MLTAQYLLGSGLPQYYGFTQKFSNELGNGQFCKYITDVQSQSGHAFTVAQVATLVFWARQLDPACP